MVMKFDQDLCVGCGCCSDVCSEGAIELDDKVVFNQEYCIECKSCIEMCPVGVITE